MAHEIKTASAKARAEQHAERLRFYKDEATFIRNQLEQIAGQLRLEGFPRDGDVLEKLAGKVFNWQMRR